MRSHLAEDSRRLLVADTQQLTPAQRLEAFLAHCRWLTEALPGGTDAAGFQGDQAGRMRAELQPLHRDAFDRMLVAQASIEPMILLTKDEVLRAYGPFVTIVRN